MRIILLILLICGLGYGQEDGNGMAVKLTTIGSEVGGKREGRWEFFKDGVLCNIIYYKMDKMHGLWAELFPNGKVCFMGYHCDGKMVGVWKKYDAAGKIISIKKWGTEIEQELPGAQEYLKLSDAASVEIEKVRP